MNNVLQHALQTVASLNDASGALAMFCASVVIYLLVLQWLCLVVRQGSSLTVATVVRIAGFRWIWVVGGGALLVLVGRWR